MGEEKYQEPSYSYEIFGDVVFYIMEMTQADFERRGTTKDPDSFYKVTLRHGCAIVMPRDIGIDDEYLNELWDDDAAEFISWDDVENLRTALEARIAVRRRNFK